MHLHHSHPYWKNVDGQTPAEDNPGYVLSTFLNDMVPVKDPGIANATSENRDETSRERTWSQALPVYSVEGFYLALNDDALAGQDPTRTIPLAGLYYSEMQFYNLHESVNGGNTTDEGSAKGDAQIQASTKILRLQRPVPSMTYMQLPFGGKSDVNLSNFQDPELPAGETAWFDQTIAIRSNNKVTIKVESASGMGAGFVDIGSITLYPTEAKYSTVLQTTLGELNNMIYDQYGQYFIDPNLVGYESGEYCRYRITITGYRQKEKDGADEKFTTTLTYYSGYWIVHPVTTQLSTHGKYSCGGFDLLLDFSASSYHKDQRIRIGCRKYHIGSYDNGFRGATETPVDETQYTEYKLDGSQYQRYIRHAVPQNDDKEYFYIYWVEYKPYGGGDDDWRTVWSDDKTGSTGTWSGCLFSQEAYSPAGLVFLGNGPRVPPLPDPETMNRDQAMGSYVNAWNNQDNFSEDWASIEIKKEFTTVSETYRQQGMKDPYTGLVFGITCQAGDSDPDTVDIPDYNEAGNPFCSQATVNAYKALWSDEPGLNRPNPGVFTGWKVRVRGTHSCFGSRQHTRTVEIIENYSFNILQVLCPDGHGITREHLQIINEITPVYTTMAGDTRGSIDLIVVRNAITARPGSLPTYNTELEGTKVQ